MRSDMEPLNSVALDVLQRNNQDRVPALLRHCHGWKGELNWNEGVRRPEGINRPTGRLTSDRPDGTLRP